MQQYEGKQPTERIRIVTRASQVAQMVKHLPTMPETWVQSLGREDPLEKEMATHSGREKLERLALRSVLVCVDWQDPVGSSSINAVFLEGNAMLEQGLSWTRKGHKRRGFCPWVRNVPWRRA